MGSMLHGINMPAGSALQRSRPRLMHLALDFCPIVDVSIMQKAPSFPDVIH